MLSAATGLVMLPAIHIVAKDDQEAIPNRAPKQVVVEHADPVPAARLSLKQRLQSLYSKRDTKVSDVQQASSEIVAADAVGAEPRKLIERPATRDAIKRSRPARSFFPSLFPKRKKATTASANDETAIPTLQDPNDGRSAVQRHLDELYKRDGRAAPDMQIEAFPKTELKQEIPALPTPEPVKSTRPIQQVSNNPFKRFFNNITPFKGRKKNANNETPDHVEPAPADALSEQLELQRTGTLPSAIPPLPSTPGVDAGESQVPAPIAADPEASQLTKSGGLPEFEPTVRLPQPEPNADKAIFDGPGLIADELSDTPIGAEKPDAKDVASDSDLGDVGDAFPVLSEDTADTPSDDNPFSGLRLESGSAPEPSDAEPANELPLLPAPDTKIGEPVEETPSTDELPEIEPAENTRPSDKVRQKMRKIAERKDLKGLKGFCPVTLRDSRELQDSRPQYSAEFEGVVFNFASAEAKEKFEEQPETYAPIAGGRDVVLASSGDTEAEGTLDHAVWFKGRLYLFTSGDTLESFIISPAKYRSDE